MKKNILNRLIAPTLFKEDDQYSIHHLFNRLLQLFSFISLILIFYSIIIFHLRVTIMSTCSFCIFLGSNLLMRSGKSNAAALISVTFLMMLGLYSIVSGDGIHDTAIFLFPIFFLIASFLLKRTTFLTLSLITIISLVLIGIGEYKGLIENKYSDNANLLDIILLALLGSATVLIIYLFTAYLQKIIDLAQKNALNYRKIFDSVKEAIIIIDYSNGKILHVNDPMLVMFGYTHEEIPGLAIENFYQPGETFSFSDAITKVKQFRNGQQNLYSINGKRKNGSLFMIEISLNIINIDGNERLLIVIRDVDEKCKMEEKIQQNEKMVALGRLAGGIAHDFRNQLTGIMGCAELLKDELTEPAHIEALDIIMQSAQQSTELTQQLLFFSRKGDVLFQTINANDIVESTISILQRSIDKRITVIPTINKAIPMINGDTGRIQNALLNLCINARDAMPGGGVLRVKTDSIRIDQDYSNRLHEQLPPGEYVTISVSDNGTGIPPELHQKIFEPFFTTKPVGKGTGIGLAAVYGTIKEHGGSIELHSVLNQGSTFTMIFPPATSFSTEDDSSTSTVQNIETDQKLKAMVIDDDPVVRMTISRMLTKIGLDVIPFSDGISAIDFYKNFHSSVNIVFLDMNMPLISGFDTFQKLRQINKDIKVHIISGFSEPEELKKVIQTGVHGYIPKPFRIEKLIDAVKKSTTDTNPTPASISEYK